MAKVSIFCCAILRRTFLLIVGYFSVLSSALPRAVAGYPPWPYKPDPALEALRREAEEKEHRERQRREEERQRREREERERREKEKEEKARKEAQEREREQRERERERERERREKERREMAERLERERMLQQQRINDSKMVSNTVQRDRSPLRNGNDPDAARIKEEPKREDELMMRTAGVVPDPRYHPSAAAAAAAQHHYLVSRHGPHILPPPHLSRAMLTHQMGGPPMSHFPTAAPGWPMDPYRDPYRLHAMDSLRYGPGAMEAAYRAADEERAKAMFAAHSAAHLRAKEPSPIPAPQHHRMNPNSMKPSPSHMAVGPNGHPVSVDMHKKEENSSAR